MDLKKKESYSSSKGKNVLTLNVIKRSGENLIDAADKIKEIIADMKKSEFPEGLDIGVSDQSARTKTTLHDLINTIIGLILVTIDVFYGCNQCLVCGALGATFYVHRLFNHAKYWFLL